MFKSIWDQSVINPEFICVKKPASFHLIDGEIEKDFILDIPENIDGILPTSFQDAEDRNLFCNTLH